MISQMESIVFLYSHPMIKALQLQARYHIQLTTFAIVNVDAAKNT
jgi:hypothetical protein